MKHLTHLLIFFLLFSFLKSDSYAQPVTPWALDTDCESIITDGIAAVTCGVTISVPAGEQWTFGMMDINGLIPGAGRQDVTASTPMYHHPEWDVNFIGNVYGITMDDCGYTYIAASANYGGAYFGQDAVIRYGDIGGGPEDLNAAGTVYQLDKTDGQPSVWAVLPQQAAPLTNVPCEGGASVDRNTGPGLGNLTYNRLNKTFYVSNFEDGRIYRLNNNGDILDSYDPGMYDDGIAGVSLITDLAYGLAVSDDGQTLIYGTIGSTGSYYGGTADDAHIFSIDLNPDGSFMGMIDNTVLAAGATYDNYVGTETLHTTIAQYDLLGIFSDVWFIADLDLTPSGQLMVGVRIGCQQTVASSYNHYGSTKIYSLGVSGLYDVLDGTVITTGGPSLAQNDAYGGVSWYENSTGGIEWVISAGDILGEIGPHGLTIINENTFGAVGAAAEPAAVISYGTVDTGDPKGVGGEVQVFRECVCAEPIACPEEVVVSISSTEICSGSSVTLSYTLDIDTIPVIVTWTDDDGNVILDPNQTITNGDCAPSIHTYFIEVICIEDSSLILTDDVSVTVYTDDISPFISGTGDGECVIGVTIDSLCQNYITIIDPIPPILAGDEGTVTINAVSNDPLACASASVDLIYDCPLCEITNLSAVALDCDGTFFSIEINMDIEDGANSFTAMDGDGNMLGTYNYADLPVTVGPFLGDPTLSYDIIITDDADPNCSSTVTVAAPDCLCEITNVTATVLDCDGLDYSISIDVEGLSLSDSFIIEVNGQDYGSYDYADLPIVIGPFSGDGTTVQNITVADSSDDDCNFSLSAGPQACYICDIENLDLDFFCVDTLGFEAYLSFTGSNLYTITDGMTVWTDVSAGSDIFLGYYPENTDLTVTITDQLAEDCEFILGPVSLDCDCNSEPGTIMVNSLFICPDDISIVDADDFLLEPGQSVYYLYHDQPTVSSADLPDLNNDVYTTGSFLINNGAVIPCGEQVYVTAIGAYENLAMPGFPDYNDFCLTVSNTIPVTFLCPITITVDETCNTDFGEFTYSFLIEGGLPAVDNSQTYDVTGDWYNGMGISAGEMVTVGPIADLTTYTITAIDANGCETTVTSLVECEKVPIELISFRGEATEGGNIISWITATETENDYFTLESSLDGLEFIPLTVIDGAGTSLSQREYIYLDEVKEHNTLYYRLKQTDYDGSYTYSSIIRVENKGISNDLFTVINNLDTESTLLIYSEMEEADIRLISTDGSILHSARIISGIYTLDINHLTSGIYYLNMSSTISSQSKKILIQ